MNLNMENTNTSSFVTNNFSSESNGSYEDIEGDNYYNTLPHEFMVVSKQSWIVVIMAGIVFLFGSFGNLYVVVSLRKSLQYRYSSMHKMLLHVCYTELLVVFVTVPLEIAWRVSIGWYAGSFACKFANFTRCSIYFLSSLVLICTSIDSFISVFFPQMNSKQCARRRIRFMIITAWIVALVSATPKYYLSEVRQPPLFAAFSQCMQNSASAFFTAYPLIESYFAPVAVVIFIHTPAFLRACQKLKEASSNKEEMSLQDKKDALELRSTQLEGVKLTFAFALVVIVCYTPQMTVILWNYFSPGFRPTPTEELFLYFLESSKSIAIPTVYKLFKTPTVYQLYSSRLAEF